MDSNQSYWVLARLRYSGLLSSQVDEPATPFQYDTSITGITGSRALMRTATSGIKGM